MLRLEIREKRAGKKGRRQAQCERAIMQWREQEKERVRERDGQKKEFGLWVHYVYSQIELSGCCALQYASAGERRREETEKRDKEKNSLF
jgi:hypothetical protein